MAVLSIQEVLHLKENVWDLFNVKLHFHDSCGGQYFSVEEKYSADFKDYIINYFNSKGLSVRFSQDKCSFFVKENN